MADSAAPGKTVEEQVANLHLDSVTGEMVSKSELKKREKSRKKEAFKAEKAPVAQSTKKAASAETTEKDLNPNVRAFRYFGVDLAIADVKLAIL